MSAAEQNNSGLIEEITKLLPAASFAVLEFVYYFLLKWGSAAKEE